MSVRADRAGLSRGRGTPLVLASARVPVGPLDNPYALLVRLSLGLALAGGFTLGLYLVLGFAFGLPLPASTPALMQVHGQVQALGFLALFIMAVGVQLFPRFHATTLDRPHLVALGGLGLAAGVVLRAAAQPAPPSAARSVALLASALLALGGVLLAVYAFGRVVRRGVERPSRGRALLPLTMAGSLLAALLLNVAAASGLALGGTVVPFYQNEALLHLELWGFASTMVLAVAGRVYPKFLLLQPTRERLVPPALGLWALGSLGVPLAWLLVGNQPAVRAVGAAAQFAGASLYLGALRLYEAPIRPSGTPYVTDPTRRWARVAFAFLLAAAAANLAAALYDAAGGAVNFTVLSSARHALAQGFLLPVIVYMAARILPGYAGYLLHRPRLVAGLVWTLFGGALLRSGAELVGGYAAGWGALVALGGLLGTGAFTVFAVGLWRATGQQRHAASAPRGTAAPDQIAG